MTNRCSQNGWVVGRRAMPADPIDHDFARVPILGCTNLWCRLCQNTVKTLDGKEIVNANVTMDVRPLFEASDPATSPMITDGPFRVYFCACAFHHEANEHPLDDLDGGIPVATQWGCAGHPIAQLPHSFDGIEVTAANLDDLVTRALAGDIPPGVHALDRDKANWIARMFARLEGTPHAAVLAGAVAKRIADENEHVRALAVRFFTTIGGRHIEDTHPEILLGARASMFVGVRDPFATIRSEPSLEHALWRLLGGEIARNTALRELARAAALDPDRGSLALFQAIAAGDASWFTENAELLARTHPSRNKELVQACNRLPKPSPELADRIRATRP